LNNEAGALTELGGINLSTPRRRILLHAHAHSLSSMGCLPPAVGRQRAQQSRHRVPPVSLLLAWKPNPQQIRGSAAPQTTAWVVAVIVVYQLNKAARRQQHRHQMQGRHGCQVLC